MKNIKKLILLTFIMLVTILCLPVSASGNLSKEEALTLIEKAYSMYADNDYYHDNIPQKQSDEYWKGRIPYIFTKEFGDWIYEPYVEKSTFGKYTLNDNYKETFRFLNNENGEARAKIDVRYNIYEKWDYSLIVNFKNTSNGWRISGVDHSSVFKDIPNTDNDKIDNGTIEALIYNSFTFYRFLYQTSNFLVEGSAIADSIKVDDLDKQFYVSDLFVCKKSGLDKYSVWEDLSRRFFEEDIAVRMMEYKKYLREFNGNAYFVHSGGPQYVQFSLYGDKYNEYKVLSNGNGKAAVELDMVYWGDSTIKVTIEFSNDGEAWRIAGGTYADVLLKKYENPNTEDTGILMPFIICALIVLAWIKKVSVIL